ncbi:MAG: hypothetical protein M3Y55_03295 [Pseudomonadota bacterium]|nr:hypothetical protein [Pseudomonadota bacterium]
MYAIRSEAPKLFHPNTMATAERLTRNFFGDLVCWCEALDFERIALTTPDAQMVITEVWVRCVSCGGDSYAMTDPDVEDIDRSIVSQA